MALPDFPLITTGTELTFKSSGGSAAITLASLANAAYRQSAKADAGANRAAVYDVFLEGEYAATPTAGNASDLWINPSSSATAGTDNMGGASGTDAAYTGYSANAAASVKQLIYVGALIHTAQATATVQKGYVGRVILPQRYFSVVLLNGAGSAFHTSDANCQIRFVPVTDTICETITG